MPKKNNNSLSLFVECGQGEAIESVKYTVKYIYAVAN